MICIRLLPNAGVREREASQPSQPDLPHTDERVPRSPIVHEVCLPSHRVKVRPRAVHILALLLVHSTGGGIQPRQYPRPVCTPSTTPMAAVRINFECLTIELSEGANHLRHRHSCVLSFLCHATPFRNSGTPCAWASLGGRTDRQETGTPAYRWNCPRVCRRR